jgi:hypothetical protein
MRPEGGAAMALERELRLSDRASKQAEVFGEKNPELVEAMELFKITNEQYVSALQFLTRAEITSSNSTNQD